MKTKGKAVPNNKVGKERIVDLGCLSALLRTGIGGGVGEEKEEEEEELVDLKTNLNEDH